MVFDGGGCGDKPFLRFLLKRVSTLFGFKGVDLRFGLVGQCFVLFFAHVAFCVVFPMQPGAPTASCWRPATARLERGQNGAPEMVASDFLPTSECSSFQRLRSQRRAVYHTRPFPRKRKFGARTPARRARRVRRLVLTSCYTNERLECDEIFQRTRRPLSQCVS